MMKIEITTDDRTGRPEIVLQSTNQQEREAILAMYARFNKKNPVSSFVKAVDKHNTVARKTHKPHKPNRLKSCGVIGCNRKVRGLQGLAGHMRRTHGLGADGKMYNTHSFKGSTRDVPHPIVRNENGEYITVELYGKKGY